jgi:hypothetical protein
MIFLKQGCRLNGLSRFLSRQACRGKDLEFQILPTSEARLKLQHLLPDFAPVNRAKPLRLFSTPIL